MDKQNSNYISSIKSEMQICFIAIIIGLSAISLFAQRSLIPEKYLKIKPAVSTREDVEKLLGKGDKSHRFTYQTTDITVVVQYSFGDCNSGARIWGLPEWTVEYVFHVWREESPRLKDILLDLSKFKKRPIGDVIGQIKYYNDDKGISATYLKNEKRLDSLTIYPTLEQKKRFSCSESK